MKYDSDVGLAD